mgnify:FL=1
MTNAFHRHGIDHLSASSINSFAAEPAMWCMERLLKKWSGTGSVASRGHAIEDGVTHGLMNPTADIEECQTLAVSSFDRRTALSGDKNRERHREQVAPTVALVLPELRQYGVPDLVQHKLDVMIPEVPVPFRCVTDFTWTTHGIVLDLKTSEKLPSQISASYARQGCIYVYGTNQEMRFCFGTPNKMAVYRLDDLEQHVNAVQRIAKTMERFLSISTDPHELAGLLAPDFDDFRWASPVTRALGRDVFGF